MSSSRRKLGCRFARVLAGSLLLWGVGGAWGQDSQLPNQLITSPTLTSAQESRIEQFVSDQFERLKSDDPATVEDARRALESPFDRVDPTIAFRLEYERNLIPELRSVLRGNQTDVAINGLLVAGRCGTPQSVSLLGEVATAPANAHSSAVRAAAIAGLHHVIREAKAGRVRDDQGLAAVKRIGEAMEMTEDPLLATTCVIALQSTRSTERGVLHEEAARALTTAIPEVANRLVNAPKVEDATRWAQVMQIGLRLVYERIFQAIGQVDPKLTNASVDSAGHALAFAATRLRTVGAGELAGTPEAAQIGALVEQADQLAIIAGGGANVRPETLEAAWNESLDSGDEGVFMDALDPMLDWIEGLTGARREDFGL